MYPPASDLPREIAKELREAMAVDKLDDDPEWPLEACYPPAIDEYVEEARPLEVDAAAQVDEYPEPSEEEGEEPGLAAGVPWAPTGPWPLARSGARAGPERRAVEAAEETARTEPEPAAARAATTGAVMLAERARAVEALKAVVDVCRPTPVYEVDLSESDVGVPVWPAQARNASDAEDVPTTEEESATRTEPSEAEEGAAEADTTEEEVPARRSDLCPTCQEVLLPGS